ncbi:hypothetical protein N0U24_11255 [Peribacillus frigoritolerans]|uniref:hypothetical protein n=1 Tax=Peribacillus frigoritolerans TaxID=450367 RepID=UPI0021AAD385|nr:hypothetical protein [Peribacillus frigoritolerans]MCT4477730.1 hypothetical protein [Peribacillus frigoritolerans]
MMHESNKTKDLVVQESNLTFSDIYSKPYFPKEYEEDIKKANLLLLPYEGFRDLKKPVFPEETMKFYKFLKEYDNEQLVGDICISDEEYAELELHADLITIASIIVMSGVLPVAVNVISNYLSEKLKSRKTELKVRVDITVVDGAKSKSISYEGDADKFEETMKAANDINV